MQYTFPMLATFLQVTKTLAGPLAFRDDWQYCAWIGWDTHESFWSSTDGTYPACSAACFSQPNCKSFSYAPGDCNLYDVDVPANVNWDNNSPYVFWDRNCEIKFQSCNTKAYQAKFDSFFWSNTLSQDQCTAACISNSNCKSLAWGAAGGECYLYDVPTKGNMDGPGDYLFSDVGCFKSSTTTSSTIPATSSTTLSVQQTSTTTATPVITTSKTSTSSMITTTVKQSTTTSAKTTTSQIFKSPTTTKAVTTPAKTTAKTTTTSSKKTTTTTKKSVTTSTS